MKKFEIGDIVECINDTIDYPNLFTLTVGDRVTVSEIMSDSDAFKFENDEQWYGMEDFKLVADNSLQAPKFKDGDIAFSPFRGFNKISVDEGGEYPVNHGNDCFTMDGKLSVRDEYATLLTVKEAAQLGYYPPKKKVTKTFYTGYATTDTNCGISLDGIVVTSIGEAKKRFKNYNGIAKVLIETEE